MSQRRVVVTGLGQISPVGNNVADAWQNLLAGVSGIGRITRFDAGELSAQIAGEVKDFQIGDYIGAKEARRMDAFIHYGIAAALQAVADAGLDDYAALDKTRVGVNIGSGIGGLPSIEETGIVVHENGPRRINPFFIPGSLINLIAGHVTILKGYQGPSYGIVSACTTGAHCIGDAARMIQYGDADVMVAGGAEGAVCMLGVGGFAAMKALSTRNDDPATASRPWDKDRDGFVMGEGAGVLVLEEYEHAKKRGAKIYAELAGFGMSSDAHHITAPNAEGPALAVARALKDAGLNPSDIDYVNAHGTSTPLGDANETTALKLAFGEHAKKLVVNSTKSMTGHLLGGAGGVEAVYSVLALYHQKSPPTINIFEQDIEGGCDLDYCANEARDLPIRAAISNSFGFGGTNGTLAFKRFNG
ncbi:MULTISPECIES: beta-ketoacyl-ACP synthase II [Eikenella]|jgi:beta-ketoacyl-acyl-carrier-protein synthase II|uniref:3-oxoacyl-[acyl-carrier-protein] synthase 2 n=2 Tax=Eikenella corrodens TaxID=539 RepID=A0A1A9RNQ2_EIKCO|nr:MULTISPECIES: beta-ketoacyl-ACP synthase II [Eikenella]EEG22704.1 beta-ketoacyl-acyl-carrier-protein synthase II [Eikenella corrodens ATCC 23834]OAM17056.1 beta-ketoacyl-[acyl-carrier-protein] synthase II [Eikenella corrodens]OAM18065.1 beta-ketoacyl-[acyl-carrier-protein] synthase II [Eikenella corrodens]OAM21499.1 beta-ketoacyl-[acyl-carrier-protein] synthase II [Eikenella corrodens]OAM23752.1 beta-ketoacyl-[acyl-carrier-protein] synthase II [Eikenella corrodens]